MRLITGLVGVAFLLFSQLFSLNENAYANADVKNYQNFYGIAWCGKPEEDIIYAKQMGYDSIAINPSSSLKDYHDNPACAGLKFYLIDPFWYPEVLSGYRRTIDTLEPISESLKDFYNQHMVWKSNDSFPNNLATGYYPSGTSTKFSVMWDFQQQVVIDEVVEKIITLAKRYENHTQSFTFGGYIFDEPKLAGEFYRFDENGEKNIPVPLSYWTGMDSGLIHGTITHEYATYSEGMAAFYKKLRARISQEFPHAKWIVRPTWLYHEIDNNEWIYQIKNRADKEELIPDMLSQGNSQDTLFVDDANNFDSGLPITKDKVGNSQVGDIDEYKNRLIAAKAGINGAWYNWFGQFGSKDDMLNFQNIKEVYPRLKLIRCLPNWDNLNTVPLNERSWDGNSYRSTTSYANRDVIYSRHPKTGELFAVFLTTNGVIKLKEDEIVTSVQRTNDLFFGSEDGLADFNVTEKEIRLKSRDNIDKGYIFTLSSSSYVSSTPTKGSTINSTSSSLMTEESTGVGELSPEQQIKPYPTTTTYYVDLNGSDSGGNGSQSDPWRTLAYACSRVPANQGYTIHLNAGTFTETSVSNVPTGVNIEGEGLNSTIIRSSINNILIRLESSTLANGNQTIRNFRIDGQSRQLNQGISVLNRNNVIVHHVNFAEIENRAMRITGSSSVTLYSSPSQYLTGIEVYNCTFTNTSCDYSGSSGGALEIGGLDGALIHDNTIVEDQGYGIKFVRYGWFKGLKVYNNNIRVPSYDALWKSDIAIELWNFSDDSEIYNNVSNSWFSFAYGDRGNGTNSLKVHDNRIVFERADNGNTAMEISYGLSDVEIYNNYIQNPSPGIRIGEGNNGPALSISNISVHNNVFYRSPGVDKTGVEIRVRTNLNYSNIRVLNNVFDSFYTAVAIYSNGAIGGTQIRNNITMNTRYGIATSGIGNTIQNTVISYNNFYGVNGILVEWGGSSTNTTISRNLQVNPQLQLTGSRPSPYYRLSSQSSPMVNAGIYVGLPYSGSAPDISAYEYGLSSNTPIPVGTISINADATYTNSTAVTLNLSATDDTGVTGYYLSTSSSIPSASETGWVSVASTANYSANISYTITREDGSKRIYVWYRDAAGNVSTTASDSIILDRTDPAITITSPTSSSTYATTNSTISLGGSASDSTSGVRSVAWRNSRGGSGTASGTTSWSISGISLLSGDNVITVTVTDAANNTETDTITVDCNTDSVPYSLEALYTFDEGTGAVAIDSSGNAHNGTINGATWAEGRKASALSFDGINDYVNIPYNAALTPDNFTVALWEKPNEQKLSGIFRSAGGNGYTGGFAFIQYSSGAIVFRWGNGSDFNGSLLVSGASLEWRHIVATYDGVTMRLYVNGALVGTDSSVSFSYNGTNSTVIGRSDGVGSFNGLIDDVRIYSQALSAEEVRDLYNN